MSGRRSVRAVLAIGHAEITQLRRNPVVLIAGALVPLLMTAGTVLTVRDAEGEMPRRLALGLLITLVLGLSVYMSCTLTLTARREQLLLKRLRTSEARDGEILIGVLSPIVASGAVMLGIAVAAVVVVGGADLSSPVPLLLSIGLLLVLCVAMAAATTGVVRGTEQADAATLPFFTLLVGSAIWAVFEPDDPVPMALPGGAVMLAVRSAALPSGAWGVAWPGLLSLAIWTLLATMAAVRWFQWEARQ